MHIHLPKPLHGWRAFVGEIAIIVIGVLIALGAEQIVEDLRWEREIAAELTSLRAELEIGFSSIQARQKQQACVDRRLAELRTVFLRQAAGQPLGIIAPVGRPPRVGTSRGTWNIALAGQAMSHMPLNEKLKLSGGFNTLNVWDELTADERDAWLALAQLGDPKLLAPGDWAGLRSAYARASTLNERVRLVSGFNLANARTNGLSLTNFVLPSAFERSEGAICEPMLAAGKT